MGGKIYELRFIMTRIWYLFTASVNRVHLVVKNGDKFPTVPVFSDRPDTQNILPSTTLQIYPL